MTGSLNAWLMRLLFAFALLGPSGAQAAHSCNLSATNIGVLYEHGVQARTDAVGTVTITCTRDAGDGNTLTYRIGADLGENANGTTRRARWAANKQLEYTLTRGAGPGTGAACADTSNWSALLSGSQEMTGTINYGTSLTASASWSYCLRVRGNQGNAQGGLYVDNITVSAMYPALSGAIASTRFTYTIGARDNCVITAYPMDMGFVYNAFQTNDQVLTQQFRLQCSNDLRWDVSISPASSTLLGLNYTLVPSPATGTGNGAEQPVTITATMPRNQQGTCTTAVCNGQRQHTVTVSY